MHIRLFIIIAVVLSFLLYQLYNNYKENKNNYLNPEEVVSNSFTSNLTFEEVENLLNSSAIKDSHIIFKDSLSSINKTLKTFDNISSELVTIPIKRNYTIPDFLKDTNDSALKIAKSDIELYNTKLEELSIKANNMTNIVSDSIKKLNNLFTDIKENMNKIESEYEKIAKNLCLPIVLEKLLIDINSTNKDKDNKTKLRRLFDFDKEIESFKKEADDLAKTENEFLGKGKVAINGTGNFFEFIGHTISEIFKGLLNLKNIDDLFKSNGLTNITNIHGNLTKTKESFILTKKELEELQKKEEEKFKSLEIEYNSTQQDFEDLITQFSEKVETLKNKFILIKEKIIEEREKKT